MKRAIFASAVLLCLCIAVHSVWAGNYAKYDPANPRRIGPAQRYDPIPPEEGSSPGLQPYIGEQPKTQPDPSGPPYQEPVPPGGGGPAKTKPGNIWISLQILLDRL